MYIITDEMKNRIQSERSDSTSVSHLFWIVAAVVIASGIIALIAKSTAKKGKEVADTIEDSTFSFQQEFDEGVKDAGGGNRPGK